MFIATMPENISRGWIASPAPRLLDPWSPRTVWVGIPGFWISEMWFRREDTGFGSAPPFGPENSLPHVDGLDWEGPRCGSRAGLPLAQAWGGHWDHLQAFCQRSPECFSQVLFTLLRNASWKSSIKTMSLGFMWAALSRNNRKEDTKGDSNIISTMEPPQVVDCKSPPILLLLLKKGMRRLSASLNTDLAQGAQMKNQIIYRFCSFRVGPWEFNPVSWDKAKYLISIYLEWVMESWWSI